MSDRIKVAFIKFGGCSAGGTEKFIQTIAAHLPKDEFEVDYFYCDSAPYIGSDWVHPDTEQSRVDYLKDHGVNLIKFDVGFKNIQIPHHPWINTNFFDVFDESKYDIIQTGRAGHPEFPFTEIHDKWIVDIITLPGMAERKSNIFKSIHISEFQRESWVKAGGDVDISMVLPIVSDLPAKTKDNLRKELNIPDDAFVCGLHQRADDGIFSPIALNAFVQMQDDKTWFVVMGGSKNYANMAQNLGIKNFIQLEHTSDPARLDRFLNTLDAFTHARSDGETFGLAIAEAMSYALPVVSHVAPAMGHVETIGDGGVVCETVGEYLETLKAYRDNKKEYASRSFNAYERYMREFSVKSVVDRISDVYRAAAATKTDSETTDEDFWGEVWEGSEDE